MLVNVNAAYRLYFTQKAQGLNVTGSESCAK